MFMPEPETTVLCARVVYFVNTSHMCGPEDAALFAANMLVLTPRGGTYTAEEYERWLLEAGYGAVEYEPVAGRSSHLISARSTG